MNAMYFSHDKSQINLPCSAKDIIFILASYIQENHIPVLGGAENFLKKLEEKIIIEQKRVDVIISNKNTIDDAARSICEAIFEKRNALINYQNDQNQVTVFVNEFLNGVLNQPDCFAERLNELTRYLFQSGSSIENIIRASFAESLVQLKKEQKELIKLDMCKNLQQHSNCLTKEDGMNLLEEIKNLKEKIGAIESVNQANSKEQLKVNLQLDKKFENICGFHFGLSNRLDKFENAKLNEICLNVAKYHKDSIELEKKLNNESEKLNKTIQQYDEEMKEIKKQLEELNSHKYVISYQYQETVKDFKSLELKTKTYDKNFDDVSKGFKNLSEYIKHNKSHIKKIPDITEALEKQRIIACQNFRYNFLQDHPYNKKELDKILNSLALANKMNKIELNFSGWNQIDENSLNKLQETMVKMADIKHLLLDFTNNNINFDIITALAKIVETCSGEKVFHFKKFIYRPKYNKNDEKINLLSKVFQVTKSVEKILLDFENGCITDEAFQRLAFSIKHMTTMKSLKLLFYDGDHSIGDNGFIELSNSLGKMINLTKLRLDFNKCDNSISNTGLEKLAQALKNINSPLAFHFWITLNGGNHDVTEKGKNYIRNARKYTKLILEQNY